MDENILNGCKRNSMLFAMHKTHKIITQTKKMTHLLAMTSAPLSPSGVAHNGLPVVALDEQYRISSYPVSVGTSCSAHHFSHAVLQTI